MTTEKKPAGWSLIRQQVKDWSRPALLALLKDLHDSSAANRDFLQARFQAEDSSGGALEKYRKRIVDQFFPSRGYGNPKLAEARKIIRDYRKATGNLEGTIELMLTCVENGTKYTVTYGDINAPFYSSLESVMNEMSGLLLKGETNLYARFRDRICHLETHANRIGWGCGDYLRDQVFLLENELGDNAE